MSKAKNLFNLLEGAFHQGTPKVLGLLDDVAKQAYGHFILGWGEDSAPAILNPYKHGYANKQHGSAYSEFSKYLLDEEQYLVALGHQSKFDKKDREYIKKFNKHCDDILANIDDGEDKKESSGLYNQPQARHFISLFEEMWSGNVETKKHPPEGTFTKGAEDIAKWLKSSHKDLKGAVSALNFYCNRNKDSMSQDKHDQILGMLHTAFGG
jgi:hypothetical protein